MTAEHDCRLDLLAIAETPDEQFLSWRTSMPGGMSEQSDLLVDVLLPHHQAAVLHGFRDRWWPSIQLRDITWQIVPCGLCDTEVTDL